VVDPVSLEKQPFRQKKAPPSHRTMCTVYCQQSVIMDQLTAASAGANSAEVTAPNEY